MPSVCHMRKRVAHGPAIRAIRTLTGVPVGEFATRVMVSQGYMSNIELGRKQPTPELLRRIADALGQPLDAISYVLVSDQEEAA